MIELLINLLTPIVTSMGASASDVRNYLTTLSSYIYAILIALAILIVTMVAVHWLFKKGTRHVARWTAAMAFIVALVVIVNMICYGPMNAIISGVMNASKVELSDDVVANSLDAITKTAEDGITLVKNNGALPLDNSTVTNINLYGWAATHPVFSGTGSAASGNAAFETIDIVTALENAGFATNETLNKLYIDTFAGYYDARPVINMQSQDWTLPEIDAVYFTDAQTKAAQEFSDTAVIVIGRSGGENADLPTDMGAVVAGKFDRRLGGEVEAAVDVNYTYTNSVYYNMSASGKDWDDGDHWLELSNVEERLVEYVTANFENVIVVINTNNAFELGWVEEYENIDAVILCPGTGTSGMTALGEILNGTVNPSGKTADTYLYDLTVAPTWNHSGNSGNHFYNNVGDLTRQLAREDTSFNGVVSFVDYVEGIYNGYKFYETAAEEGLINYEETVQYPFGYGLSYTSFTQEITDFKQDNTNVTVTVKVTNTGSVAGKDVVELYYTAPYTNGGIEKASVNLIDFEKTAEIQPGESRTLTLTVALEDMASYDSSCIKTANGGYILEAGEYIMSIRSDSHTVLDSRSFTLSADIDYSTDGRPSDGKTAVNQFSYMESDHEILSRANGFANYAAATAEPAAAEYELSKDDIKAIRAITVVKYKSEDHDNPDDVMPTTDAKNGVVLADLAGKSYDDPKWDLLLDEMSLSDMDKLINTGGWMTAAIDSIGKVATSDCDGPSGLSNYLTGANGTQFPTEVLMAMTWSKEIATMVGEAMGQEFAAANNYGWYGPAMNLHRSAFSGRNFEYYSEDAVLSGIFASHEVNGAAKYGVYSYIKHFAANDQETNRTAFLTTWMTEQTFRETCLKPFEIVVKNFDFDHYAMGVMTAYNWTGLTPIISNSDLLNTVLRDEWGFVGAVISDYNGGYGYQITDAAIRAGNDLMLGQGMSEANQLNNKSATVVTAMRQACKNILYTVANSGYYKDATAVDTSSANKMDQIFTLVNVGTGVLVVGIEALVIGLWLAKRKKAQQ